MPCMSDSFLVVSDFNADLIRHYCVLSRWQNYLQPCMCTVQISFSRRDILSQQKDLYLADTHPRPPLKYWCYIKFPYSLMKELWKLDTDEQDINNILSHLPLPLTSLTLTYTLAGVKQ